MDIWGSLWLILIVLTFPFGYKPIIAILSLASIFSAGKILSIGNLSLPIFFVVEIFTILRLLIPYNNGSKISFNDRKSLVVIFFIPILWIYSFFLTVFFDDLRVYTSIMSMEDNYYYGGVFLKWSAANINQLMLLSVHMLLAVFFYKRRYEISKKFYAKTFYYTSIVFIIISLIWKFSPNLYGFIGTLIFNNANYAVNALFESRLSGTFLEPSLAGLFIGTFSLFFILSEDKKEKIIGVIFLYLSYLNFSSTLVFTLVISFMLHFGYLRLRTDLKVLWLLLFSLFSVLIFLFFYNQISYYFLNKSATDSGIVRSGVNENSINNFVESLLVGVGVGSERTSSLIITIFNNLGIFLGPFLLFSIYKLLSPIQTDLDHKLRLLLLICFFGSFASIPEMTGSIMWNLIFCNILIANKSESTLLSFRK